MFKKLKEQHFKWNTLAAQYSVGKQVRQEAKQLLKSYKPTSQTERSLKLIRDCNSSAELYVQVIEKKDDTITLGYALDSAQPRSGKNVVAIAEVKCAEGATVPKVGQVLLVKCTEVSPVTVDKKFGVRTNIVKIIRSDSRQFPDTSKEIIHKAQAANIFDCSSTDAKLLFEKKLSKQEPIDTSSSLQKPITKFIESKIFKSDMQQIVYGIVYSPDEIDSQGDTTTAEEIEKAAHYFIGEADADINYSHETGPIPDVKVVESWIAPMDMTINNEKIKKGSWIMATKIENPELWKMVEAGEINAYSIEGPATKE